MKVLDAAQKMLDRKHRVAAGDFLALDDARKGLGDAVAQYVLGKDDETVLSELSALPADKLRPLLEFFWGAGNRSAQIDARRDLFWTLTPEDASFVERYVRVLDLAYQAIGTDPAGSKNLPRAVAVFFAEVFATAHEASSIRNRQDVLKRGLTAPVALSVCQALGGDAADMFDALYFESSRWGWQFQHRKTYRARVDLKTLAEADPASVIAALRRVNVVGRIEMLHDLGDWGLLSRPLVMEAVFALASDGSKTVREAVLAALSSFDPKTATAHAIQLLEAGDANARLAMAQFLGRLGTDEAAAALSARLETEKTSKIRAAIETSLSARSAVESVRADDETGYAAIDGSWVPIPPIRPLATGERVVFGAEDRAELARLIDEENRRIDARNKENEKRQYAYIAPLIEKKLIDRLIRWLNAPEKTTVDKVQSFQLHRLGEAVNKWLKSALRRLPEDQRIRLSIAAGVETHHQFSRYMDWAYPPRDVLSEYVRGPTADLRTLDALEVELKAPRNVGPWNARRQRPAAPGDTLRLCLEASWSIDAPEDLPREATWPYLAAQFAVLDEALGLTPTGGDPLNKPMAIRMLSLLPKTPMRFFGPLLEAATGETKGGRAEARTLLAAAPGVADRLLTLLEDSREAIRAGAAGWIGERGETAAVKPLRARLKKEKSDRARAAMLTALERLGEDLADYLGPKALSKEAEAGMKKAKFDKLDWLGFDHLPAVSFRDGARVPENVLRWWIFLAFKLKQPGGNTLFDLYLAQLKSEDAEAFSTWLLDSWLAYDSVRPPEEEGNAHAKAMVAQNWKHKWYKEWYQSEETYFAAVKREYMSAYLNSGAASKGLLGLVRAAPPSLLADRVRRYLRDHGQRTSQASALLEMLAAAGDPISMQVVIAAATRLKQKGVQKFAGELVQKVAEARNWTMDELADRTIPTAGLDDDGCLALPCGDGAKPYEARLDESLQIQLFNPDGKSVKTLSSGQDEATKASKKQLSASKKELKQILAMQSARMYEALCAERSWRLEDWIRDFREHPVMRKLTERVVWLGLDPEGEVLGAFRPTAEGDYTDAEDDGVSLDPFARIRLGHSALLTADHAQSWAQHMEDYEIPTLFPQFGRDYLVPDDEQRLGAEIADRKGWMTDAFTIRGTAAKLGYERGEALDGGFFNEYRKSFNSAGVAAVIEFTGNSLPEDNVPAALVALRFEKFGKGRRRATIPLAEAPPVLLSECWNDYHAIAANAAFDPDWEKLAAW